MEDAKFTASDAAGGDRFGVSVSIGGDHVNAGAYANDDVGTSSGSAYLFAVGPDCNHNGVADECDIRDGYSPDDDGNGVPDECHCSASMPVEPEMLLNAQKELEVSTKNRFLSFTVGQPREYQVIRVTFVDLPGEYSQFNGKSMWVGHPADVSELAGRADSTPPTFRAADLQCDRPLSRDWTPHCVDEVCDANSENAGAACSDNSECEAAVIHVYSRYIVPDGTYEVRVLDAMCAEELIDDGAFAPPALLTTSAYGDVCAGLPKNNDGDWGPPDGQANITSDVLAIKQKFANQPGLIKARAEIGAARTDPQPDLTIDMSKDVLYAKEAFEQKPYPFPPTPWWCP